MEATVSYSMLDSWNACNNELYEYEQMFGTQEIPVTRAMLVEAAGKGLDIGFWFFKAFPDASDDMKYNIINIADLALTDTDDAALRLRWTLSEITDREYEKLSTNLEVKHSINWAIVIARYLELPDE